MIFKKRTNPNSVMTISRNIFILKFIVTVQYLYAGLADMNSICFLFSAAVIRFLTVPKNINKGEYTNYKKEVFATILYVKLGPSSLIE